jgi:hypothetical protein
MPVIDKIESLLKYLVEAQKLPEREYENICYKQLGKPTILSGNRIIMGISGLTCCKQT